MSFEAEYDRATNIVINANEKVIRAAALELFKAIIVPTPVKTGRLRGNWQASINSPRTSELADVDSSETGGPTILKGEEATRGYSIKDTIYFTNNLPYAEVIEFGGLNRRPFAMVRNALKIFGPALEKMARVYNK